jgi:hypothetical protein
MEPGKGQDEFYHRLERVRVIISMTFGDRFEDWIAFKVGCVST